jgi:hypothetical protein
MKDVSSAGWKKKKKNYTMKDVSSAGCKKKMKTHIMNDISSTGWKKKMKNYTMKDVSSAGWKKKKIYTINDFNNTGGNKKTYTINYMNSISTCQQCPLKQSAEWTLYSLAGFRSINFIWPSSLA